MSLTPEQSKGPAKTRQFKNEVERLSEELENTTQPVVEGLAMGTASLIADAEAFASQYVNYPDQELSTAARKILKDAKDIKDTMKPLENTLEAIRALRAESHEITAATTAHKTHKNNVTKKDNNNSGMKP